MNLLKYFKKYRIEFYFLMLIIFASGFLRFYDLGYSNYQGDEIKALFNPYNNKDFLEFLFDQRKGPNQFLVTFLLRDLSDNYYNHFIMRFPFALAGFLSVIVFYLVLKNFFNSRVGLLGTILFGSSGFLIAFSRIVQYQSFVIFFGLLTILLGQIFSKTNKNIYLYLGFISLATSILFHYDGIFFGLVFGLILVKKIYEERNNYFNYIASSLLFILILGTFYVPFILNLDKETLDYYQERLEGDPGDNRISSSIFNFELYQPVGTLYIYIFFIIIGMFYSIKNYENYNYISLILWSLTPFIFMEGIVESPGTHTYTYLIPVMGIAGLGMNYLLQLFTKKIYIYAISIIFVFISFHQFLQSYVLYVEHKTEYPWQEKKYLYFDLKSISQRENRKYYMSVFGFPYNRSWMEIKKFLIEKRGNYDSSEKSTIGNFYLKNLRYKDNSNIYIEVELPQSFSNANRKGEIPEKVFENPNGTKSYIYFLDN